MDTSEPETSLSFGQAMQAGLANVAASQEQSTQDLQASTDHKRAFLLTFQRWERLFRRKDGDAESDKWLIAEYYKSLKHLTAQGFDVLTEHLKENCTFFPTVAECLKATKPESQFDYAHPFIRAQARGLVAPYRPALRAIGNDARPALSDQRE